MKSINLKAFTLIELLIVVAIIAILAAIAVPNFLEAQTRAKVSRARSDIRTLATGLEAYRVDFNAYPGGNPFNVSSRRITDPANQTVLERLSTPIAYVTTGILPDPFASKTRSGTLNPTTGLGTPADYTVDEQEQEKSMKYAALVQQPSSNVLALVQNPGDKALQYWILFSVGPDLMKTQVAGTGLLSSSATVEATIHNIYDPTNGTISRGDLFRIGGSPTGPGQPGNAFYRAVTATGQ